MAVYHYDGERGKVRYELSEEEYEYLTKRAAIVESIVEVVAEKLIDIPKNEERIKKIVEELNNIPNKL